MQRNYSKNDDIVHIVLQLSTMGSVIILQKVVWKSYYQNIYELTHEKLKIEHLIEIGPMIFF